MTPTVAILAGGLATRLRPLTEKFPKALIDCNGKPFMEYQLALLRREGFERVVICTGYEAHQIEDTFGDGSDFGIEVQYSYDGDTLLGTGGALKKALPLLGERFLVIYGDSFLGIDYLPIFDHFLQEQNNLSPSPLALMTVFLNENQFDKSNVLFQEGQLLCYDKHHPTPEMQHIDWGLGILDARAFDFFEDQEQFDLASLYERLVSEQQLIGYEVFQRFYEIGSFEGIESFKQYITDHPDLFLE